MNPVITNTKINIDDLTNQISLLLEEARSINNDINLANIELTQRTDAIDKKINESIGKLEVLFSELDQIDEAAGVAMDELIIEQAKVLTQD